MAPTSARTLAYQRFTDDTAEHQMTVLHDDGLYRHLRFAKPGTGFYHYNLVTFPGHLTVTGDMGTWTFARTEDMLGFFRSARRDYVNPGYWAEKLQAGPATGRTLGKEYSQDAYRAHVTEALEDWLEGYYENEAQATSLRAAVQETLLDTHAWDYPGSHHETATEAIRDFSHRMVATDAEHEYGSAKVLASGTRAQVFTFADSWEWDLTDYSHHFLWICYAIQAGIHTYDAHQATTAPDGDPIPETAAA